jgi:penicillin-binding protein 1C
VRQQGGPTPAGLRSSGPLRESKQLGAARRFLQRAALPALMSLAASAAHALATFNEVRTAHRPSDAQLLDRHGVLLQTLRTDHQVRRLPWVPLQDLSPALLDAIVLSEDRRFWQHSGIDWSGVARSAWANAWNQRTQGASTLTMQLAGLMDDGLARPAGGRSLGQKFGQALTATQLEARWKKHEILEAYLNSVPLRGELVGVAAMAQALFGKHASGLDAQEAAITAALVRAPNAAATRVAERACGVLSLQHRPCTGLPELAAAALQRSGKAKLGEALAPHLARQVLRPAGPVSAHSTLDAGLQRLALRSLRQHLAELSGRNVEDGAVVVLDNASGEVLAWVGSSGPGLSGAHEVDGVLARRQPGSTLKPFVYQLAFEQRLITPASLLDDSPAQLQTGGGLYLPQNYDRRFRGWVSARQALAGSLNIPAVRVGAMLPPDALLQRLNAWGLQLPQTGGYYGQALALGSAEVTLLDLSNAYRALANGGRLSPPRWVLADTNPRAKAAVSSRSGDPTTPDHPAPPQRVADASASHLVTDILADNAARAATFGLDSALALPGFAAVKTGTSKDMRDNWCIGFSSRYTVGVWVGNASGAPMHQISGVGGAAPVWRSIMLALHEGKPSAPPGLPPGVVAAPLRYADGREPPRTELFLAGSEQSLIVPSAQIAPSTQTATRYGITHPTDGSIFALDPDIPPAAQRIVFEGEPGQWRLDGRPLPGRSHGRAARANDGADTALQTHRASWAPWPGKHELSLLAPDGRVLQTVHFEVRGAAVKGSPGRPALAPNTSQTGKLVSVR